MAWPIVLSGEMSCGSACRKNSIRKRDAPYPARNVLMTAQDELSHPRRKARCSRSSPSRIPSSAASYSWDGWRAQRPVTSGQSCAAWPGTTNRKEDRSFCHLPVSPEAACAAVPAAIGVPSGMGPREPTPDCQQALILTPERFGMLETNGVFFLRTIDPSSAIHEQD